MESLWTIEFRSAASEASGVAVFNDGFFYGGNANFFYWGHSYMAFGHLYGDAYVEHYAGSDMSPFGAARKLAVKVAGRYEEPEMRLFGFNMDEPNAKVEMRCIRRVKLF